MSLWNFGQRGTGQQFTVLGNSTADERRLTQIKDQPRMHTNGRESTDHGERGLSADFADYADYFWRSIQREGSRNRCRDATVLICPWQDPTTKRNLRNLRIILISVYGRLSAVRVCFHSWSPCRCGVVLGLRREWRLMRVLWRVVLVTTSPSYTSLLPWTANPVRNSNRNIIYVESLVYYW
jgi:hypothetical protein